MIGGMNERRTVAALFVDPSGPFSKIPGVDLWDEARDARTYHGNHPVVAFPPCKAWGRMWRNHERATGNGKGQDGGCFASALESVRSCGGTLEHPWGSGAWSAFGIDRSGAVDEWGGRLVKIEQGWYGHVAPKETGIYLVGTSLWVPDNKVTAEGRVSSLNSKDPRRWCTPSLLADALVLAARGSFL